MQRTTDRDPAADHQHNGERQKAAAVGQGRGQGGGGVDTTARKRKRLLTDAAKLSAAGEDSLKGLLEIVTCVQAKEILKASPPNCFVGELLANLLRLLPRAATSLDGASSFIKCLEPFEDLDDFVLPANFYRAIAMAKESPPPPPRGHNWKRKNDRVGLDATACAGRGGFGAADGSRRPSPQVTGLQTVRAYLCMNGRDAVECGGRTVVTTLTRALLGSWEGSVSVGRELFDQSVLKNPDRSGPVGLGLEVLLQCLVQEDTVFCQAEEAKGAATDGEDNRSSSDDDGDKSTNNDGDSSSDDDSGVATSLRPSRPRRRRTPPASEALPSTASTAAPAAAAAATAAGDETRACVTIVGNYVRACSETSASFFRDILPKVLLMGMGTGGGGGSKRRGAGSRRIPRRLAAFLRSLVVSTRSRSSFNLERMVIHTVREVKGWGDPDTVLSAPGDGGGTLSALCEDAPAGGAGSASAAKASKGGGGGDKLRRRGLVLACLDVLGPTAACLSLIRREMVDGERKAALRSAVPDGLLEYRRTCSAADAEGVEAVLLGALSSLLEDSLLGVRLSATAAIGEGCSSDCAPAVSLLLRRCLDTAPKVRALAIRLLVDEFRLGIGAAGATLARAVLLPPFDQGRHETGSAKTAPSARGGDGGRGGASSVGGSGDGRLQDSAGGDAPLLGELLRHRKTLEESDTDRFPRLLRGLVDAVMCGETLLQRPLATVGCRSANDGCSGADSDGTPDRTVGGAPPPGANATVKVVDQWHSGSWQGLAAPASRLWAACRPSDSTQLDALDEVLGDIFRHSAKVGVLAVKC